MSYLLHGLGFSPQVPARRAVERDEAAIAEWWAGTWAEVRGGAAVGVPVRSRSRISATGGGA